MAGVSRSKKSRSSNHLMLNVKPLDDFSKSQERRQYIRTLYRFHGLYHKTPMSNRERGCHPSLNLLSNGGTPNVSKRDRNMTRS